MNDNVIFPPMPKIRAQWAPIYLEPIMGSGEQITIAIVALRSDGTPDIQIAVREEKLKCMYGTTGAALINTAHMCIKSCEEFLGESKKFSEWEAPISGVSIGASRPAAGNSMAEIMQMAMRLTASLSQPSDYREDVDSDLVGIAQGEEDFIRHVRNLVAHDRPVLMDKFNQKLTVIPNGNRAEKFGYVGDGVVANFSRLRPGRALWRGRESSRNKLWLLARLRDLATPYPSRVHCLIINRPNEGDHAYSTAEISEVSDSYFEISEEAKSVALTVKATPTPRLAADFILEKEAA